jgi:hypothetical protein
MTVPARGFVRRHQADGVVTVELVNAKSMNILGSEATDELTAEFHRLAREAPEPPSACLRSRWAFRR